MIAYLKGKVIKIETTFLIIDTGGIGYKVLCTNSFTSLKRFNDVVELYIYTHVREDQLTLFGFKKYEDLKIFELLLEVSGIGPKMALTVTNALNSSEIILAIQKARTEDFIKISGVGKKLAQKIIVELQPKLGKIADLNLVDDATDSDLIEALVNLGFTKTEATQMAKGINIDLPLKDKIKLSLKKSNEKN